MMTTEEREKKPRYDGTCHRHCNKQKPKSGWVWTFPTRAFNTVRRACLLSRVKEYVTAVLD